MNRSRLTDRVEKRPVRRAARLLPRTVALPAAVLALAVSLIAGPPFFTDDPEPIDLGHWELYLATMQARDASGLSGTLPHVEANYGFAPNFMAHLIIGASFDSPRGGRFRYGFGDMELGVKFRFVEESDGRPMVGTFPHVEVPTGSHADGLGSGQLQAFLPIWAQKSWGPWTTYGGGGLWINPGPGNKNYGWFGWEVQRDLSQALTLGAELFTNTPTTVGGPSATGFNFGAIANISDHVSGLFSIGRDVHGPGTFFIYVALYSTFK